MGDVAKGDIVGKLKKAESKWSELLPYLAESLKPIAAEAVRARWQCDRAPGPSSNQPPHGC